MKVNKDPFIKNEGRWFTHSWTRKPWLTPPWYTYQLAKLLSPTRHISALTQGFCDKKKLISSFPPKLSYFDNLEILEIRGIPFPRNLRTLPFGGNPPNLPPHDALERWAKPSRDDMGVTLQGPPFFKGGPNNPKKRYIGSFHCGSINPENKWS